MTRIRLAAAVTFRSLHVRNFRLFFIGQGISQVGTWMTQIALTLLVLRLTSSGIALGLLTACAFGPVLLFGPYGGVIADRFPKRRLLYITQTLQMLQSFTLAGLAFMHRPPIVALYATAAVGGLLLAFDNPARRSFVTEMVPADLMHNAVTLNSTLMTSSRIIGPALAGLTVVLFGFGWTFLIDAVSYLAVLYCLAKMRRSELRPAPIAAREPKPIRAGVRYARSQPALWVPLVMVAIIGTFTFNFSVTLPLFVKHSLGGSDATYTVLYSVLSIGSFVGALFAAHRGSAGVRHVMYAAYGFAAAMVLFALSPNLVSSFPAALAVGLSSIAFMSLASAVVQIHTEPSMRGRVLALQSMLLIGSTPIGGPILGFICDRYGPRSGIVVGGAAALAAALWAHAAVRRSQDAGAAPTPATAASVAAPLN
jgi:MFS family permease